MGTGRRGRWVRLLREAGPIGTGRVEQRHSGSRGGSSRAFRTCAFSSIHKNVATPFVHQADKTPSLQKGRPRIKLAGR